MTELNFDEILRPYRKGEKGGEGYATAGSLFELMVNRLKFPADIAGEAIWQTCYDIAHHGVDFKGEKDVTPGRQLRLHIKALCSKLMKDKAKSQATGYLKNALFKQLSQDESFWQRAVCLDWECPKRTRKLKKPKSSRFARFWLKPRGWWKM